MWPFSRLTLLVRCQTQLQLEVSNVYSTAFCFVMVHKHVPQQGMIKMSSSREEDTEAKKPLCSHTGYKCSRHEQDYFSNDNHLTWEYRPSGLLLSRK